MKLVAKFSPYKSNTFPVLTNRFTNAVFWTKFGYQCMRTHVSNIIKLTNKTLNHRITHLYSLISLQLIIQRSPKGSIFDKKSQLTENLTRTILGRYYKLLLCHSRRLYIIILLT